MACIACIGAVYARGGVTLTRKESSPIPVEADSITIDSLTGLGPPEIAALPAFYGRRQVTLGDLFEINDRGPDGITVNGDLSAVKKIGWGNTTGRIMLEGPVGHHTGAFMKGGELIVQGDAGDWLGAHMSGGTIMAEGSAGHFLGGAYSGETKGMSGGTIVVWGGAGREVGSRMRRGTIAVAGDVGEFAGVGMLAGSVFVGGRLGERAGAGMKRGTIVGFGEAPELLPTFRYACTYRPVFMRYYLRELIAAELIHETQFSGERFRRYVGDMTTGGKGEVLLRDQSE
jgi:formylmethanofuran dehydrogenase subunit C